jgi:hypothetical protein
MIALLRSLRDTLVSLKLTLALLGFAMVLIFAATLDQVNLGIWAVQEKYFRSFIVYLQAGPFHVPAFPGGYLVGGLLLVNLIAAFVHRFTFSWRKAGILASHFGLIVLLVGELLTGLWQEDFHLRLDQGETRNYAESFRENELVVIDTTDAQFDDVVAIPERTLADKTPLQHPKLPFRVVPRTYFPNSVIQPHHADGVRPAGDTMPRATAGFGRHLVAIPQPITRHPDERNLPTFFVEFVAPDQSLGTWLVSLQLAAPQTFEYGGRQWRIALRPKRNYQPFTLTLLQFSHDRYPGTQIPKNFSSRLRLTTPDGRDDREVLIYMNNPLRYGGLTFYQAGFENNDRTTVLQVVRNPSWLFPYIACVLMSLGLLYQFTFHLVAFARRRRAGATLPRPGTAPVAPATREPFVRSTVTLAMAGAALAAVAFSLRLPTATGDFDLAAFARLPTLVNGRVKPLDTVARTSLLMMQGRQRVAAPDGRTLLPAEWLLDVLFQPAKAETYQVFEVVHPDVLALLELTTADGAGGKRFALRQFSARLGEVDRQAKLADGIESAARTPFQRAIIQLRDSLLLHQRLQASLVAPGNPDFLAQLEKFAASPALVHPPVSATPGRPAGDPATATFLLDLARSFSTMDAFGYLHPIPPAAPTPDNSGWKTAGAAWNDRFSGQPISPAALAYAAIGRAWVAGQPAAFNQHVHQFLAEADRTFPALARKSAVELRFNTAQPFYTSAILYVAAFLVALGSWLRWPAALGRAAFALVLVAFLVSTAGIATRMWLESRPPVTNLYSSALFVGWGAVALCWRKSIATASAARPPD